MGAIRFSIDSRLVRELAAHLPLKVFVETGTYEGASMRAMLPFFDQLHTIELAAPLYASAVESFKDEPNVRVHHGQSAEVLQQIVPKLRRRSVLYWLDAHWCDEKSAGGEAQCPLLEELEAIGSVNDRSVVLIDDARLFMAPPPMPAATEGWPQFSEVLERLSTLNPTHELLAIDDVLVFFPPRVRDPLREFAHHHAVDWLNELQANSRVQNRLERLREDLAGLRKQTAEQGRKRAERVSNKLTALASRIQDLENEVHDIAGRTHQSEDALEARLAALANELESATSQLGTLFTALDGLGEQLRQSQSALDERVEPLGARLASLDKRVEPLGARLAELEGAVKDVRERSGASLDALGELPKARGEIASLAERIDAFGTELERLPVRFDRSLSVQSKRSEATLEQVKAMRRQMRALQQRLDERERSGRLPRTRAFFQRLGMRFFGTRLGSRDYHSPRELRVPRRYRRQAAPAQAPAISIVTPAGDEATFVDRTIRSVLDQDYERLEYIVESCASSQETAKVLERHRDRLARCDNGATEGAPTALNRGFERATGDVLSYVRPNALLLPGALPYVAGYFERHPEVDVIYGHRVIVDADDKEIGRWVLPRHRDEVLSWADYVPAEALFWRRGVWEAIGGEVDANLRETLDWDLLLRFREVGANMARVPRFLGAVRVAEPAHAGSTQQRANGNVEADALRARIHGRDVSEAEARRAVRGYVRRHVMLQKLYRLHLLRY